jgi:hypothetical protein
MWQKPTKKTIYTLNVGDYCPQITALTYPFIEAWARRIGAEFHVIRQRRFPTWPVVYEKLQIYELAQQAGNDWSIYIDSDTLVHPETIDYTVLLRRDTVAHNGNDMAAVRWDYDRFFLRDGRHIGSCNWFAIASDWTIELWKPIDDLTLEEALRVIHPTINEQRTVNITPDHLIDDWALSRNIAKFGLKFTTIQQLMVDNGLDGAEFFWHAYTIPPDQKLKTMQEVMKNWKL